uniref:Integrase catalytic domain-containing protein n=1 Tax=Cajanus cajan TaxID=3821 RepID=A0A151UDD1_CAJCA
MAINEDAPSWITPIRKYIVNGELPADHMEAKKLRTQEARYSVVANELYRRGFSTPLLKCIDNHQADYVLQEIHEGICGSHSVGRTMAAKVLRAGYYWPTLKGDCAEFVKKCFTNKKFNSFLENLGIRHRFTLVEHPQSNGQAEAANKVILTELKKRLGSAKGAWAEELPEVLWAYQCTPQSTTKETPFLLTYGDDAMIPVEVGEPSFR